MTEAIETVNLNKTYNGDVQALKSLNLRVNTGEAIGYLGPNGAGKTTTIQVLLNLIRPTSGDVYIFGEQMRGQERRILRQVGALVELPGFYDYLTPDKILKHICRLYRMDRASTSQHIKDILAKVRLSEVRHKPTGTFSTGMYRRLAIAQALVHDPDLIILDEPTVGLDPKGVREMRDLIRSLNKTGKTVFMSSHNLTEVTEISSRVIFLNKGEVVGDEQMDDLENRLGSNQIEIKLSRPLDLMEKETLSSLEGIVNVIYGHHVLVEYEGDLDVTQVILQELVNRNFPMYSFTPRSMTLEDLYLQLFASEVSLR